MTSVNVMVKGQIQDKSYIYCSSLNKIQRE
jgi:hypothetical protein